MYNRFVYSEYRCVAPLLLACTTFCVCVDFFVDVHVFVNSVDGGVSRIIQSLFFSVVECKYLKKYHTHIFLKIITFPLTRNTRKREYVHVTNLTEFIRIVLFLYPFCIPDLLLQLHGKRGMYYHGVHA